MNAARFALAIAIVESNNDPNSPLGDDGCAFGAFQMHIDFVWEWAVNLKIVPNLDETLYSFQQRLIEGYFAKRMSEGYLPIEAAASYHLGHPCFQGDPDWPGDYVLRFEKAQPT